MTITERKAQVKSAVDENNTSQDDTEEGLSLLLGFDVATLRLIASEAVTVNDEEIRKPDEKQERSDHLEPRIVQIPVELQGIDDLAFIVSPTDGSVSRPIASHVVQVVDLIDQSCSDSNNSSSQLSKASSNHGLIAARPIRKGQVIYTERAMEATQYPMNPYKTGTNHPIFTVKACHHCFRSLEPASTLSINLPMKHLWPVADYAQNLLDAKPSPCQLVTHVYECNQCRALFCCSVCASSHKQHLRSCCVNMNAIRAMIHTYCAFFKDDGADAESESYPENCSPSTVHIEPCFVLATRMFCHATQLYHSVLNHSHWKDPFSTFCGQPNDLLVFPCFSSAILSPYDLAKSCYLSICSVLQINPMEEHHPLTLSLFQRYISVALRNGFQIATQSPFSIYYQSLVRSFQQGRKKNKVMEQLAYCLGSQDGKFDRTMDQRVDEKCTVTIVSIYKLTCKINHSCEPNAQVQGKGFVDAHIDVIALRDIAVGEEVTLSYIQLRSNIHVPIMSRSRRLRELQNRFLFTCQCNLCTSKRSNYN